MERLGYEGVLGEGADRVLGWRSPHRVYRVEGCERVAAIGIAAPARPAAPEPEEVNL